ncbi:membrane protein [Thermoclostridium stercorarium subsp. stercorarium DSM 8532]|nr:membrane protein [Thermoclostridium stercorarium subsp. stercorarium DSM 8532]
MFFGKFLKERHQEALKMSCGISVLFIGIAGAMEGMLTVNDNVISSGQTMLITLCLAIGTLIGEIIDIEHLFERFGEWLRLKTGNSNDNSFVNAFVTASLTVCIGAMAIVGAIQDGITGNWSILATKAILDFIIVMVMTCSLGKGCMFSAVPVFIFEGVITALSSLLKPIMTDLAMKYLSLVGSVLIFCVGLNLVWGKKIKVANMLPAIVLAVIAAFLPVSF